MVRTNTLNFMINMILFFSGLSQITLGGIKPVDILLIFLFIVLVSNNLIRIGPISIFIYLSIIYAFFVGLLISGNCNPFLFLSDTITFALFFAIVKYVNGLNEYQIIGHLKYLNISMFLSNSFALIILIKFPLFREIVVDTSSLGFRLKGLFNQANGYAFVLLINIPISAYLFLQKKTIFNLLAMFVAFIALIFTQSRGAILALIVSIGLVYSLYIFRKKFISRARKGIIQIIFVAIISYIIIAMIPQYIASNYGLNLERINPLRETKYNRSIASCSINDVENDRVYLLEAGVKTLFQYPFGLGYAEQHKVIGDSTGTYRIPHNFYITLLLNYGIIIGSIWIYIIFRILKSGFGFCSKNDISPNCLFFYLHIVMVSVSLYYLTHSPEWIYFYIIFGIYCSFIFRPHDAKLSISGSKA